jgi:GntR family transcriptional regulator
MYANGEPMQLATSYLPWSLAKGTPMAERDTGPGGIYSRLADMGHGPVRFTEDVSIRMPTPEEAEFLRLTPPQPEFFLVRMAYDANDRPVETCEHIMSGDRWQLSYAWTAD